MSAGPHHHSSVDRAGTGHEHASHEGQGGADAVVSTRSLWTGAIRSPTAWLLGAFLAVAAYFALTGDPSRTWTVLPYFAIAWMFLHHLGGHGHTRGRHGH